MPDAYQPDWDIYTCHIEDKPAIIGLDLGLRRFAPLSKKPYSLFITVYLNQPRPDGFPHGEEFSMLGEIEDWLVQELENSLKAHFVGRTMSDGIRDFYFYTSDIQDYEQCIASAMARFPNYRYECGMKEDKTWELYFDYLFPDVQEFQRIQNRKVLRTLKQHGDIAERERVVDHWIYFSAEAEREIFGQQVQRLGFAIEARPIDEKGPQPYGLKLSRTDRTDEESIDTAVMMLWELAQEMNARYDGWETVIVAQ
ncbi:DUF695 domain-containing protein [Chitinophaga rhizophila]|uniref:DUF695 domain-containing protein n=1 Tax=Chitinophaga rhizophila TaxID=2866212 RepID=A0ABS7GGV4_9BACT|nr:DUF695 domain-containing protein [Chitinophaga rhizophila]MBW8686918.1 DUF695 domain-containing protein [Chitinophaga rhizophila]